MSGQYERGHNPRSRKNLVYPGPGGKPRYDEPKERTVISLTPTAKAVYQKLADDNGISLSEAIEQVARGTLTITD